MSSETQRKSDNFLLLRGEVDSCFEFMFNYTRGLMTHCPPVLHPVKLFASALLISVHRLLFFMGLLLPHCLFFIPPPPPLLTLLLFLHSLLFTPSPPFLSSSTVSPLCSSSPPVFLRMHLLVHPPPLPSLPLSAAITTHSFNLLPDAEQ